MGGPRRNALRGIIDVRALTAVPATTVAPGCTLDPRGPQLRAGPLPQLTWDAWSSHQHGASPSSNQPPHCFKRLYEATAPWNASPGTPGNLISDELDQPQLAKGIATEELRQVIQKWADTGVPFGFFFAPSVYAESLLPGQAGVLPLEAS